MNDSNKHKKLYKNESSYNTIKITGKNEQLWKDKKESLWGYIQKKFSEIINNDFLKKRKEDFHEKALDNISESALALTKKPQLTNAELQASVKVSLSVAKKNNAEAALLEAKARFTNAHAAIVEEQAQQIQELQSKKVIEALIKKGLLIPVIRDGKTYLIYKLND